MACCLTKYNFQNILGSLLKSVTDKLLKIIVAIFLILWFFQDKVRVEIKSFDVLEDGDVIPRDDSTGDKAQNLQQIKEKAMTRKNAVNNFLDGKNCLTGVRIQKTRFDHTINNSSLIGFVH